MGQDFPFDPSFPAHPGAEPDACAARAPDIALVERRWDELGHGNHLAAWDALAQWASEPNPFFESWYMLPSLKALDPDGKVSLLVLEADGQFAGLMPVERQSSYYGYPLPHLRNWTHSNCFLGAPLVARGFERIFWRELLNWADRKAHFSMFLHLAHLPAGSPLHEALLAELTETRRPAAMVHREERAMLASNMAPDAYLAASLTTKKRKELRRQHRRLAEEGELRVERHEDTTGLEQWVSDFLRLEQKGWKGRQGSALASDVRTMRLFAEAMNGAARRGRLERLALQLDGKPIAMLASFIAPPGAFSFKTAFDESFARYSPGVLLQCENLALLAQDRVQWVDSCASQDHPMIDHLWRERRSVLRHSIGIGGALRRAAFSTLARREMGGSSSRASAGAVS